MIKQTHQTNNNLKRNQNVTLKWLGVTHFFWSPIQSTGTSTSFCDKKASAYLARFELEISLICLRHWITAPDMIALLGPNRSSFAGLNLKPAQSSNWFRVISTGEIYIFLKCRLISSLLSMIDGRKKINI